MSTIEIDEDKLNDLIEALKRATHKDFDKCSSDVCEHITRALKAVDRLSEA